MAKPSLLGGLMASDEETESGDSGAAFEELRKRFINGDAAEAQDAFMGLMALCDEGPEEGAGGKPSLHIMIGKGR